MRDYETVYSTERGDLRAPLKKKKGGGPGQQKAGLPPGIRNDGIVRIRKESKGKGGKTVTSVYGVPLVGEDLNALAKRIKQQCGTGGQVKDGVILIQGDRADMLAGLLEKEGYKVKKAGG